ncbi:hypothetical protein E2C01_042818 [Portunus trituberculatus]|uniref:Uncharacterized protein n=1 Tax=Portunus trituberculatus TaxID=210409 RepID=A0A5B7FMS6_PORTR|nr:hypothetical protein [Portunus trituberculatus]
MKVSEVEAEFHRRISEVRVEFRGRISDLQAEFCRVNSATEGVAVLEVSLDTLYARDGVHLSRQGVRVWLEHLKAAVIQWNRFGVRGVSKRTGSNSVHGPIVG